jgi:hypothetical protein
VLTIRNTVVVILWFLVLVIGLFLEALAEELAEVSRTVAKVSGS